MFYTYLWLREDGTPYYAGKGKGRRAYTPDSHCSRPPKDRARIIVQEFEFESDALAAEVFLIAFYGRKDLGTGCLRNLTDGGDGVSGYVMPEYVRQKVSIAKRGKAPAFTEKDLQRRKQRMQGNTFREGLSPWNAGIPWSEETKQKMRKPKSYCPLRGPMSQEQKEDIRATLKAKVTPEYRELMRQRGKLGAAARWEKVNL